MHEGMEVNVKVHILESNSQPYHVEEVQDSGDRTGTDKLDDPHSATHYQEGADEYEDHQ